MRAIAGDERTVPERAVLALVNRRQRDIALPTIEVQSNASETALRTLRFSEPPIRVLRWTAHNRTARDFRYSCGVRYTPAPLEANRGEFRLNALHRVGRPPLSKPSLATGISRPRRSLSP